MPRFVYKAKTGPKDFKEGMVDADTQRAAIYKISQMGYFPIEVREQVLSEPEGEAGSSARVFYWHKRIGWRDLSVFTRQLADLLGSGLAMLSSLEVLSRQTENIKFRKAVDDIRRFVKDGGTFSDGLARHPLIFSNIYVSMVKAGEAGGMLEGVLNRLADYAEAEDQLRNKVRSALAYPALMVIVGIVTIIVLLTFVIPRLVIIFEDIGQALPLPTLILIRTSSFLTRYGWVMLVLFVIIGFILGRGLKTKEGSIFIDKFKMNIFIFGELIKKAEIARFARTLGTLLTNGVPMMQSLSASSATVENRVLRRDVEDMAKDVTRGVSFSKAIVKVSRFPLFVTNMVAVGDESGHLEKALLKVAESCERDVDRTVRTFTALLEPVIILVMGAVVGFIVISMLLPIFQINLMAR